MSDISIDQRVELIEGKEDVYKNAKAGSQGVVSARKVDDEGFSMAFVQWDEGVGEANGWTYESHLRPVRSAFFDTIENKEDFLDSIRGRLGEMDDEWADVYLKNLDEAVQTLEQCEAFLVVGLIKEIDKKDNTIVIIPKMNTGFLSDELMAILEAQIVQLAALSYQEMVQQIMQALVEREDDEDGDDKPMQDM